jgi:hypothetical protein
LFCICINSKFLGLIHSAYRNFKSLDIKSLQLDTLGYLILDHSLNLGELSVFESVYNESSALYASNIRDTWGFLCQSIEDQSFESAIDFHSFYIRLETSIQNISTETSKLKLNIAKLSNCELINFCCSSKCDRTLKVLSFAFGKIFDNRDMNIFDTIDPSGNLKGILLNLCNFDIQEAIFYYHFIQKIRSFKGQTTAEIRIPEGVCNEHYTYLINLFVNFQESDISIFCKEITSELISFLKLSNNLNYDVLNRCTAFLFKMKEILILFQLKIDPSSENISKYHNSLISLKSHLVCVHENVCLFQKSKSNFTSEQNNSSKILVDWFDLLMHDPLLVLE